MPVFEQDPEATCVKIPLHKNKIIKKTISIIIRAFFTISLTILFILPTFMKSTFIQTLYSIPSMIIASIPFVFIFLWIVYLYAILYYKTYYYNIKEDSIIIREGVWFKSQISFPYYRIQDVYIDQDIFDKLLGLYDVHLATAAPTSARLAHIDGLNEENATKIRDILLEKIKKGRTLK
ncbi:MAG: PH domain-containing protein [Candidatus Anstonellales archaeon]